MLVIQTLFSTLLSLSLFSSIAVAAPLPVLDNKVQNVFALANAPPPLPTRAEVEKQLNVPAGDSLFYSCDNVDPPQGTCKQARDWAKANHPNLKVLSQLWINSSYPNPWQQDEQISKQFWDIASEAMAAKSAGTVYVVLPPWKQADGKDWYAGSFWARKEWPVLQSNSAVTAVIRTNAATGATIKIK
ncbi:hypothetical protein HYPSUDRAFT_220611 [Hypholoma sublateritium FD-334 SS-4]|uniref:Secreted protein n=1 Tax=Hypholoma sublateritium (strain FD-334 SS-4) TaxID=945553 RepID=A0A0D2P0L3_HYPSF|nr:hypothetical protein HYPSUDRAFT_220611 [Hypholoma sublateritium FD-334 SS-4]